MTEVESGQRQSEIWRFNIPTYVDSNPLYGVHGIPSDNNDNNLELSMHTGAFGDVFLKIWSTNMKDNDPLLQSIRLRSSIGGGANPFITEAFARIVGYFKNGMQEFIYNPNPIYKDRINSNSHILVEENTPESRIKITGIQDDDGDDVFIDIDVLKNGDVTLRFREIRLSFIEGEPSKTVEAEMMFKTREHEGQYPFMNDTLTKLAKRILKAKRTS